MSGNSRTNRRVQVELVKPSRKVLYHFSIFSIIREILINEDWQIEARDEKRPPAVTRYSARGEAVGEANDGCVRAMRNAEAPRDKVFFLSFSLSFVETSLFIFKRES